MTAEDLETEDASDGQRSVLTVDAADSQRAFAVEAAADIGTLWFNDNNPALWSIDGEDGSTAWFATPTNGDDLRGPPAVGDGETYWATFFELYAINDADGSTNWSVTPDTNDFFRTGPRYVDGTIYVGGTEKFYAIDPATQSVDWTLADTHGSSVYINRRPAIDPVENVAYVAASSPTQLIEIDLATQSENWYRSFTNNLGPSITNPAYDDTWVWVAYNDVLHAVGRSNGNSVFTHSYTQSPTSDQYAYSDGETVWMPFEYGIMSFDITSGTENWTYTENAGEFHTSVLLYDDSLFFGASGTGTVKIDAATGTRQAGYEDGLASAPVLPPIQDGSIFVPADDQVLARLDTADLSEEWDVNVGGDTNRSVNNLVLRTAEFGLNNHPNL